MFRLNESNRFALCLQGVDLRRGIDGLCGCIRRMSLIPTGDVYVFVNKNRTTMKLVHWERGSFVIYYHCCPLKFLDLVIQYRFMFFCKNIIIMKCPKYQSENKVKNGIIK